MYICMLLSGRVFRDHDCFMLMIYIYISLSNKVTRDHSCGGMIAYIGELHEEVPSL